MTYSNDRIIHLEPNNTVEELIKFSSSKAWQERRLAASSTKTPAFVLEQLLKNEDVQYNKKEILENPNIPEKLLDEYATHEDWLLRASVASNPTTSEESIILLLRDKNAIVALRALSHPKTPTATLLRMMEVANSQPIYASAISSNPSITPEIIDGLVQLAHVPDNYTSISYGLSCNSMVPLNVLLPLLFYPKIEGLLSEHCDFSIVYTDLPIVWKLKHLYMRQDLLPHLPENYVWGNLKQFVNCKAFLRERFGFVEDVPNKVAEEILSSIIMGLSDEELLVEVRQPLKFLSN